MADYGEAGDRAGARANPPTGSVAGVSRRGARARLTSLRQGVGVHAADGAGEVLAGVVSALVTIAYCISFSALIFQGVLQPGMALGLWALLAGSAVIGVVVALTTSLPPADAGPDTPAVAVMSVLAATIAATLSARGLAPDLIVLHVLVGLSLATALTGIVLFVVGRFQLGQLVRFVPFPVVGGFLAASGWLMMAGGVEVATGQALSWAALSAQLDGEALLRLALGLVFAFAVFMARRRWDSVFVLPIAFFSAVMVLASVLWVSGLMHRESGWFIAGAAEPEAWRPLTTMFDAQLDWVAILGAGAEIGAVAGVTLLALLLDVSSLEVARAKVADLDREFRFNGLANLAVAPLGGLSGNLSMQSSRLLLETGARSRAAGVVAALSIGLVLATGVDLAGLVPAPLLGGLLIYLGGLIMREALFDSPAQRTWTEFGLALLIMTAIIQFGYLVGVVLGFIGACLMFAFSYSRIGVVRRHLTRAQFSSNVERSPEAVRLLRANGQQIHVFWLTGFIFFGSSNGVFEQVRRTVERQKRAGLPNETPVASPSAHVVSTPDAPLPARTRDAPSADLAQAQQVRFIVLDFSGVSGFDSSAVLSLVKLRNYADDHAITLHYAGMSVTMLVALEHAGLFGANVAHQAFPTRNDALEWCEEALLQALPRERDVASDEGVERWLAREMGDEALAQVAAGYFQRREITGAEVLYAQGSPSDTLDLIMAGSIAVSVVDDAGRPFRIRRMFGQTVVGEMGFFRYLPRAATVSSEGDAVIYSLSRSHYERLLSEQPEAGVAFLHFIIRALSDRVEFANQEIAALI